MNVSRDVILNKVQEGSSFLKFNSDGSLSECFFYVSPKLNALCYNVSKKAAQNAPNECKLTSKTFSFLSFCSSADLLKDCEVRPGLKTDLWLKMVRAGKVREHQGDLAFSILHSRGRKSLDLLASDMETRDFWVKGLQILINETFGTRYRKITDR